MNVIEQKAEQIVLASIIAKPELFDEAIKKNFPRRLHQSEKQGHFSSYE